MSRFEYSVLVEPLSEADGGGYLARVPDLPGCMSDGESPEEALTNLQDAIASWIEGAGDLGRPVPGALTQRPPRQRSSDRMRRNLVRAAKRWHKPMRFRRPPDGGPAPFSSR